MNVQQRSSLFQIAAYLMNRTDLTTEKTHSGWALGCTCNHLHPPEIKDAKEMLYELISREKVALQLTNAYVFFSSCSYQTLPLLKQPVFILADTLFTRFRWQTLRIKHHKISNTISVVKVWAIGEHNFVYMILIRFAAPVEGVFIFGSEKVHMGLVLQLENEVLVDTIGL